MLSMLTARVSRQNILIALSAAVIVAAAGIVMEISHADTFFVAVDLANGAVSGNAKIVNDAAASSGKAV
jgi:hypothetical protein